ncbi:hypothetical protein DPMN_107421 [Dreissena polymorpha]|uniref:Uncharacterized protein n=1 Tax=Dreissena polymorpha TaxID=45954 RepID=A0A9D4K747_DREPO|nr:hypothetical protein DPMN_107421 [Dreissena polymorpha]
MCTPFSKPWLRTWSHTIIILHLWSIGNNNNCSLAARIVITLYFVVCTLQKPPTFLPDYKNPCWLDGNTFRCLPYFQLIGMCKSATSDLFKRLHMHPDIIPNRGIFGKEIWYWS